MTEEMFLKNEFANSFKREFINFISEIIWIKLVSECSTGFYPEEKDGSFPRRRQKNISFVHGQKKVMKKT